LRLRVILLVLAISSLILVSFMLPLALLLRTFAADSAVSGATIRAQFMAPLLATVSSKDLQISVERVNQQNPSEPVTLFLPADGSSVSMYRSHPASGWQRAQELQRAAPGGVAIFVAVRACQRDGRHRPQ